MQGYNTVKELVRVRWEKEWVNKLVIKMVRIKGRTKEFKREGGETESGRWILIKMKSKTLFVVNSPLQFVFVILQAEGANGFISPRVSQRYHSPPRPSSGAWRSYLGILPLNRKPVRRTFIDIITIKVEPYLYIHYKCYWNWNFPMALSVRPSSVDWLAA